MPLPSAGAATSCTSEGRLDPLVLLSARSDWRRGILLTLQSRSNASIESTWPMGRNPHHSPEGSDW
ncbi:hypothetical protein ES708_00016 [subsurface metagenome]